MTGAPTEPGVVFERNGMDRSHAVGASIPLEWADETGGLRGT